MADRSNYTRAAARCREEAGAMIGDAIRDGTTLIRTAKYLQAAEAFEREARRLSELGQD